MTTHPTDGHLTLRQKNTLADATESTRFRLDDFVWRKLDQSHFGNFGASGCGLMYRNQYFGLRLRGGQYDLTCSPNPGIAKEDALGRTTARTNRPDFGGVVEFYRQWLDHLMSVPPLDRWAQFEANAGEPFSEQVTENEPFTPDEQRQIWRRLDELEAAIIAQPELEPEKHEQVRERFRYLREAGTRVGRFDWHQATYGTLFQMALQGIITAAFWGKVVLPLLVNVAVPVVVPGAPPSPLLGP